ncbi:TetR/AcrR family transcriptional regulator [Actinomadura roseirufa]|uniref:TetR/AcrR family transcriptional regulator n=1 Tax=Actinomadura roseirufa TaxID=2094049 RepID=UPI0010415A14|nr:TetR/AcrR family transcriptional regulator [Actinomadura roseirufa]
MTAQDATRPRRADARRNRERVLAAARETFAADGPDASLNEIARRAGVGPGTLYRHFPTRGALQAAVITDRVARLRARADELVAAASPGDALAAWIEVFLAHARSDHGLGGAVLTEPVETGVDCHAAVHEAARTVLGHAQRAGAARPDAHAADLVRLVTGIALSAGPGDPDPAQTARLLGLVMDALRPPSGREGSG